MNTEQSQELSEEQLFESIDDGRRSAVEVIYVAADDVDLGDIIDWGHATGWWNIRVVKSVPEAISEQTKEPAELMILLNTGVNGAKRISKEFPQLPLSIANFGGFNGFPTGWPAQVVLAQWAAPRPSEFGNGLETALGRACTEVMFEKINTDSGIVLCHEVSQDLLERLRDYPEERFILHPRLFEEVVAEILQRMGFQVTLTPYSGDKGRDVLAVEKGSVAPMLMLVECKRYAEHRLVGPEPIARIWSRLFQDSANMALVVTTSGFTNAAKEFAKEHGYQVALKDGIDFRKWVESVTKIRAT